MTRHAAAALLEAVGPRWRRDIRRHSQQVKEAYEPLLAAAPRDGVEVRRGIAYGPHPRQVVDVFVPAALRAHGGARVVVFVHGGAFVRGDKRTTEEIYDNVLFWFARQGCVGINVEYRLAPEASYPAGAEDVASALRWLQAHVAEFGGDGARVFLIGHSSGGTHAATAMFDPVLPGSERPKVAGLVLVSARLRADRLAENPNAAGVAAYFGDDATLDEARSPCMHTAGSDVPVMIVVAEFENPLLDCTGSNSRSAWPPHGGARRASCRRAATITCPSWPTSTAAKKHSVARCWLSSIPSSATGHRAQAAAQAFRRRQHRQRHHRFTSLDSRSRGKPHVSGRRRD